MRVAEKNGQLILRTPWADILGSVFGGLVFLGFAYGMFWAFARDTTLTCTRLGVTELQCQISQARLGQVIKQMKVVNPQQAIVQSTSGGKSGTKYRMALVTVYGTTPVTDSYSSTRVDGHVDQFNRFIANPTAPSISIDQPAEGFVYIFLLAFAGGGLFLLLRASHDTFTFDRQRDMLTVTRVGLRGRRTRQEALTGLQAAVRQSWGSKGSSLHKVHLVLAAGGEVDVDWTTSREAAARNVADRIQEFVRPGAHST